MGLGVRIGQAEGAPRGSESRKAGRGKRHSCFKMQEAAVVGITKGNPESSRPALGGVLHRGFPLCGLCGPARVSPRFPGFLRLVRRERTARRSARLEKRLHEKRVGTQALDPGWAGFEFAPRWLRGAEVTAQRLSTCKRAATLLISKDGIRQCERSSSGMSARTSHSWDAREGRWRCDEHVSSKQSDFCLKGQDQRAVAYPEKF